MGDLLPSDLQTNPLWGALGLALFFLVLIGLFMAPMLLKRWLPNATLAVIGNIVVAAMFGFHAYQQWAKDPRFESIWTVVWMGFAILITVLSLRRAIISLRKEKPQ